METRKDFLWHLCWNTCRDILQRPVNKWKPHILRECNLQNYATIRSYELRHMIIKETMFGYYVAGVIVSYINGIRLPTPTLPLYDALPSTLKKTTVPWRICTILIEVLAFLPPRERHQGWIYNDSIARYVKM